MIMKVEQEVLEKMSRVIFFIFQLLSHCICAQNEFLYDSLGWNRYKQIDFNTDKDLINIVGHNFSNLTMDSSVK